MTKMTIEKKEGEGEEEEKEEEEGGGGRREGKLGRKTMTGEGGGEGSWEGRQ